MTPTIEFVHERSLISPTLKKCLASFHTATKKINESVIVRSARIRTLV